MAIISIIRATLRARSRGLELKVAVKNGILRTFLTYLRLKQLQFLLPSGYAVFQRWVASKDVQAKERINNYIETLQDGEAKLFWVGLREESSKVILFLHGGGYVLPLSKGHIEWADYFRNAGKLAGQSVCVALLDYSLCPENTYPKQMRQAALALDHIIGLGYSPSQIVIGGDSAGAHLSLSLLSHIMFQYPVDTFPALRLAEPLGGCFLISPLLSLDLTTASYRENEYADLLSIPVIRDWGQDLLRGSQFFDERQNERAWGMPLCGNRDWWDGLGKVVRRVYLTGGGEELFRDHIIEFGQILKGLEGLDVQVHIDWKEAHDRTYMDFEDCVVPSKFTIRLGNWVVDCFAVKSLRSE
ncbi:hypothetical protein VE00_05223 [Pseudogymnoascus sp. WSF 3629]|nr:hypothetical protein VE00_05223 [Pseudogymnoascus sp. WSF 3629]